MDSVPQRIKLEQADELTRQRFMARVYGWMVAALAISGGTAFLTIHSEFLLRIIFLSPGQFVFYGLMIGELVLVVVLSRKVRSLSVSTAIGLFIAYAVLNGLTLSSIFLVYTGASITRIFIIAALMFGGMSLYGMKTKTSLRSAGRYLMMGLMGIIIASLANLLFRSDGLSWLLSIATVFVFTGLTAYDTQKLMSISVHADNSDAFQKVAVIGALQLYLDFINIFLALLRLFGRRR